ncbi:hypothetical protein BpHYR1_040253 [Brachionus plicatilis]|uniref:RNA-directed DNA polymerase from mobile element jockey-like n=1 Tax=Brachionus plicatilis TaxID=10195 RepID=A0A3M7RSU0_BRAPC|nr:hypothetical protein BpHYR1_040253 [Brachionus plicatilis]
MEELNAAMKSLNNKSAPGPDKITNKRLLNFTEKEQNDRNNQLKYRQISATNSIIKLIEKVMQTRLIKLNQQKEANNSWKKVFIYNFFERSNTKRT